MEVAKMNKLLWLLVVAIVVYHFGGSEMRIQQKQEQMLFTVVTVDGGGSGSGVVAFTGDGSTFILTAKHVVEGMDFVDVTFYPSNEVYSALVIKESKTHDLAVLEVEDYEHHYKASLSSDMKPRVYDTVWKVGGGLGLEPYPGSGIITGLPKFGIMHNALTIFGDSGGGIFIEDELGQFHLTGIIVSVGMVRRGVPLPHVGYAHDIATISRFINSI